MCEHIRTQSPPCQITGIDLYRARAVVQPHLIVLQCALQAHGALRQLGQFVGFSFGQVEYGEVVETREFVGVLLPPQIGAAPAVDLQAARCARLHFADAFLVGLADLDPHFDFIRQAFLPDIRLVVAA